MMKSEHTGNEHIEHCKRPFLVEIIISAFRSILLR